MFETWQELVSYISGLLNNNKSAMGLKTVNRNSFNGAMPVLNYNIVPDDDIETDESNYSYAHKAVVEFAFKLNSMDIDISAIDEVFPKLKVLKNLLFNSANDYFTDFKIQTYTYLTKEKEKQQDFTVVAVTVYCYYGI